MSCKMFVLLVCTLATLQVSVFARTCNVPPKYWCDSEQIALACGVYEQCKVSQWTPRDNAGPVNFTLYYESLCPDCKGFITTMLFPTYQKIPSLFNLTIIPYGNAFEKKDGDKWVFECQHGPQECLGNIIETCTIAIVNDLTIYFPFINCMEISNLNPKEAAENCGKQFAVPLDQIFNCTTSSYGNQLEHQMALQTDALSPQHQYVPWVTLNGVHTEKIQNDAQTDLLKLICDTYQGQKPVACQG
jgi:interferon gamma-inducible protein 30